MDEVMGQKKDVRILMGVSNFQRWDHSDRHYFIDSKERRMAMPTFTTEEISRVIEMAGRVTKHQALRSDAVSRHKANHRVKQF